MVRRQLSKLSRNGCDAMIATAQKMAPALLHRSFFFSSASASSNLSNASPKFPIPSYCGKSRPIPKTTVPPMPPREEQDRSTIRHQRDIANAIRPSYESQTPLLLRNLHATCDAVYFWRSLEYWRAAVGDDVPVEVEVGKSYNSGMRATMRFGEYLDYLALSVEPEGEEQQQIEQEVAYLAQNELFPQVLKDIPIPHFCENGEHDVGEGKLYHTMLWMGPRNTVSALHFDPLDNLLMQVVGWKRVLLFPPDGHQSGSAEEESDGKPDNKHHSNEPTWWHYAGAEGNQYNTSAVDIENPDRDRFPNFEALAPAAYECILGPGDGVYIPKKWWHHVRSLEMSVSANVWWR